MYLMERLNELENFTSNLNEIVEEERDLAILYQVSEGKTREFGFERLEFLDELGIKVDLANYTEVAQIDYRKYTDSDDDLRICEVIFQIGNTNQEIRNEFKNMRSVSVSDIIKLHDKYYYCDSFGFTDITDRLTSINESEEDSINEDSKGVNHYVVEYNDGAVQRCRRPNQTEEFDGTDEDLMRFLDSIYVDCTYPEDDGSEDEVCSFEEWLGKYEDEYDPSGSTIVLEITKNDKVIYKNSDYDYYISDEEE